MPRSVLDPIFHWDIPPLQGNDGFFANWGHLVTVIPGTASTLTNLSLPFHFWCCKCLPLGLLLYLPPRTYRRTHIPLKGRSLAKLVTKRGTERLVRCSTLYPMFHRDIIPRSEMKQHANWSLSEEQNSLCDVWALYSIFH